MSRVKIEVEISGNKKKWHDKFDCEKVKSILFQVFLFIRYMVDLLIDYFFGLYYAKKKVTLKKCDNPIILESCMSLMKKIKQKELKSEELVQACIDRINEVNPLLNSIVDNRFERALEEAREIDRNIESGSISQVDFEERPFLGIPFTTKESTAVEGLSFSFGLVNRKGKKASFDADYVTLMKKAGGICLGVSNIPQLNLWQETSNPIYGTTNNPYDTTRNVGGSSGGESSILAAGGVPISIGTDIGGSCRIPAFMCGVFGHKPTSHLIPTKGMTFRTGQEEQTMVVVGPMTKYADDITPLLKVLVAENANKLRLDEPVDVSTIKIYYVMNPKDPFVSPFRSEMKSILTSAVHHFNEVSKYTPEEVEFQGTKFAGKLWKFWMSKESNSNFMSDIMNREGKAQPCLEIVKHFTVGSNFSLSTIYNFINSLLPTPKDDWAKTQTEKLKSEILETLGDNGVLLYPSAPWPASYHYTAYLRPWNFNLFSIWNVLKFPVTQVPMGLSGGLPVGIQVVSAPYQDRLCIAVAKELERAFGGYVPPFPTC